MRIDRSLYTHSLRCHHSFCLLPGDGDWHEEKQRIPDPYRHNTHYIVQTFFLLQKFPFPHAAKKGPSRKISSHQPPPLLFVFVSVAQQPHDQLFTCLPVAFSCCCCSVFSGTPGCLCLHLLSLHPSCLLLLFSFLFSFLSSVRSLGCGGRRLLLLLQASIVAPACP